jgi:hypothetical protein
MSIISEKDKQQLLSEALDPTKITLTCGQHAYAYGGSVSPNFKCKKCLFTMFIGLLANTPPEKRMEQMEMLEFSVHELIEAKQSGKMEDFFARPEVYVNGKQIGVPKVN